MEIMGSYCTRGALRKSRCDVTMSSNALYHKGIVFHEHINVLMSSFLFTTIVIMVLTVKNNNNNNNNKKKKIRL